GEILASGNIVIMGACRGVLHAGAEGDRSCFIIAYTMAAQQLRIADMVATVPPEISASPLKVALIKGDGIILTDYTSSQFKGGQIA
ncbi:MAG: septum site-determining protein MinC, partial [Clostridiales bacterium]